MANLSLNVSKLLILGASTRAAAGSAYRAGFAPLSVDLFADRDLSARFPAYRAELDDYPASLARIATDLPDAPWIYTGALENHPSLIEQIAERRSLLGITGSSLRSVRDPSIWTTVLRSSGLPALDSIGAGDKPPTAGSWLLKPIASASGRGICRWILGKGPIPAGSHIQTYVEGLALGATFLGDGQSARFIGVTRQLLGFSLEGLRTNYRGSLGPWPISDRIRTIIVNVGATLASAFNLCGLFGVDFIVADQTAWPVEINPRYSASVEVLETALGLALLADHARAFGIIIEPEPSISGHVPHIAAKRILFATKPGKAPIAWPWTDPAAPHPTVADLPGPNATFEIGDPVLTVLAQGSTVKSTLTRLKTRLGKWRRRIDAWPYP